MSWVVMRCYEEEENEEQCFYGEGRRYRYSQEFNRKSLKETRRGHKPERLKQVQAMLSKEGLGAMEAQQSQHSCARLKDNDMDGTGHDSKTPRENDTKLIGGAPIRDRRSEEEWQWWECTRILVVKAQLRM